MANEYVTSEAFKATLDASSETYMDDDINVALEAASRALDQVYGRRFWKDADANQVRYYTPIDGETCRIDDLVELTRLEVDRNGDDTYEEVWTRDTDFKLHPLNAEADGKPYELIKRRHRGIRLCFPPSCYEGSVKVTAQFGWPEVPPTVVEATSLLAHRLLERARSAPLSIVVAMDTAVRLARTDPDVALLMTGLGRLRGPSGGGFG